jgi:uncharacterized protein YndB with AHSA1/START domain
MPRTMIASEILIAAPPQAVWELIGSTQRYAEWVVNTLAVTRVDAPVAEEGVSYDERNRVLGPWTARSTWRVLSADPPRHTIHEGTGIPLARHLRLECTLWPEPGAEGAGTRYRHLISYEPTFGLLGILINAAVAPSLRRDGRRTVQRLKVLAESEAKGTQ